MKNKNILVTGAAGFIASHLVRKLVNLGANVTIITQYKSLINNVRIADVWDKINIIEADIRNIDSLNQIKKIKPEIVYHLAAYNHVGNSFTHISECFDVNAKGTANLMEACKGCSKFVYTSTSEIYGYQEVPFREDATPKPISPYGITKYSGELYARMKYHQDKYPVVVLRPFNNFGPYQSEAAIIPEIIINCLLGREIKSTEGKQTREFNFVENIIDGFILAAEKDEAVGKIINLGATEEISIKDLILKIHQLTNSISKLSIGSSEYRPTEIWRMFCDNKIAKKTLGWEPKILFEEGLKKTIEWYKNYINLYYNKDSGLPRLSNLRD
ncbi:hypothetical protein CL617_01155 [archaeon]|nr:hypothetical protein [archaeon]|tara:strand:- start:1034 stop:2017 length:984 start_codon:yes stop_codon:yes gene_type:complete